MIFDWHAAVVGGLAFFAGSLFSALRKDERHKQLCAKLLAKRIECDRLQLACDKYDRAAQLREAELVELQAENFILRNSGDVPPEAA